jgi:hypothetical protein
MFTALVHNPLIIDDSASTLKGFARLQPTGNQQQLSKRSSDTTLRGDGTFNGAPIYWVANNGIIDNPRPLLVSKTHCIGDNFHDDAWQYKSCRFHNLCFDTETKEFVIFADAKESKLQSLLRKRPFMTFSTTLQGNANETTNAVALGGINKKWGRQFQRLKWFPTVRKDQPESYYMLPESIVLIPYHSMNGANPGHLIWDDFFPIYNLLEMFQLHDDDDHQQLLLLRYVLNDGQRALWATCDIREEKQKICEHIMNKFLPLLLGNEYAYKFTTTNSTDFQPNVLGRSNLVCAKTAVAGIGALTDHGLKKGHGWEEADYKVTHNAGRGGILYTFRNRMIQNIGLPLIPAAKQSPHRIVFSSQSSEIPSRKIDFEPTILAVQQAFPNDIVQGYIMSELSLQEQIKVATEASVYITVCGGGAATAMFLPRGASVIIFFTEDGGAVHNRMTHLPARLDWDLFQHMSHLRVHWMPRNTFKKGSLVDLEGLIELIRHELYIMSSAFFD